MKKIIPFIRSLLFCIISFVITVPWSFIFVFLDMIPFLKNRKYISDRIASCWGAFCIWLLKITCGISCDIKGYDKLEKGKSYIIIGKHESTYETLIMHTFMRPAPIYVLKKQLKYVPFMGWCLASSNQIAIDRSAGGAAVRIILKEGKKYLAKGHNIIIFPQGTRTPPTATLEEYPYKVGFLGMIKQFKVDIVPLALNTGKYWGKGQFIKKSGVIKMEYMEPIKYEDIKDLTNEELLVKLRDIIEKRSKELYEQD
ncbi:MAG: lysophospholipid acyltransferase family protein [Rickettsiales bacterium]|nr:MAG: lysophospholipid acyltransferase family protein [Rickettsiales bacterium]